MFLVSQDPNLTFLATFQAIAYKVYYTIYPFHLTYGESDLC